MSPPTISSCSSSTANWRSPRRASATYKQTLDLFTQRFKAGKDSKLAVERAQAAYESSNADIAALTAPIAQQENALSVLLGAYPRAIERGTMLDRAGHAGDAGRPDHRPAAAPARHPAGRAGHDRRQCRDRRGGGQFLSTHRSVGPLRRPGRTASRTCSRATSASGASPPALAGPIFPGRPAAGQLSRAQQAFWDETIAQYKKTVMVAFHETSDALIAQQTLVGQRGARCESQVERVAAVCRPGSAALRRWTRELLRGARSRAAALPGRGRAGADAARPARRGRQSLQGARRRLESEGRTVGRAH